MYKLARDVEKLLNMFKYKSPLIPLFILSIEQVPYNPIDKFDFNGKIYPNNSQADWSKLDSLSDYMPYLLYDWIIRSDYDRYTVYIR